MVVSQIWGRRQRQRRGRAGGGGQRETARDSERQRPRHWGREGVKQLADSARQSRRVYVLAALRCVVELPVAGTDLQSRLRSSPRPLPGTQARRRRPACTALHVCTSDALQLQYISNALSPGPLPPRLSSPTAHGAGGVFTATQLTIAARTGGHHHDSPCHDCLPLAAQMTDRRSSAAPAPKIPPAPPPPPPKQRHRSYFERFVAQPLTTAYGSGSRPPSVQANRPAGGPPNPLVPRLPGYVGVSFVPPCLTCVCHAACAQRASSLYTNRVSARCGILLFPTHPIAPSNLVLRIVSRAVPSLSAAHQHPHRLLAGCQPQDRPRDHRL
jgi:hypothetical protein